jgi:hypothetical protein
MSDVLMLMACLCCPHTSQIAVLLYSLFANNKVEFTRESNDDTSDSGHNYFVLLIVLCNFFLVSLVLINLLIAMMSVRTRPTCATCFTAMC